jgi:hypothetical protein
MRARRNAAHCFMGGPKRRRTEGSQTAGTLGEMPEKIYGMYHIYIPKKPFFVKY